MVTQRLVPVIPVPASEQDLIDDDFSLEDFKVSFTFDFNIDDFVLKGGQICICDPIENIKMWIIKTLKTERSVHPVYAKYYGNPLLSMLGRGIGQEFLEVIMPEIIRNTLLVDERIRNVDNFEISIQLDSMFVEFRVILNNNVNFNIATDFVIS